MSTIDVAVIGAGTAGSIVAHLLARTGRSTLLLEAGGQPTQRHRTATEQVLLDENWDYRLTLGSGAPRQYNTGKVLGGSSSVNGALAFPPTSDTWEKAGLERFVPWAQTVDPLYPGPLTARTREEIPEIDHQMIHAWPGNTATRIQEFAEHRGDPGPGPFVIGRNIVDGNRVDAYSWAKLHGPPVETWTNATVNRIDPVGKQVKIEVREDQGPTTLRAKHVILCAGAIGTPALLLRSGFSTAQLPNLGCNLQDHATMVVWSTATSKGVAASGGRWRDLAIHDPRYGGAVIGLLKDVRTQSLPRMRGTIEAESLIGVACMRQVSQVRGSVTVEGEQTIINLPLFTSDGDLEAMDRFSVEMLEVSERLAAEGYTEELLAWPSDGSLSPSLRRHLVRAATQPGWHAVGTVAMGTDADRLCTPHGEFADCDGIWVMDASIIPDLPPFPTNLITARLAATLAGRWAA